MSWTDERIALLKKMWKEGKSAAEIAKTLAKGVTRNAVIGKAHRMGLSGRPSPIKKPPEAVPKKEVAKKEVKKEAKAAVKKTVVPVVTGVKHNPLVREVIAPRQFLKEEFPTNGGVALIDLTERMCKWPFGDPREDNFTFCGRGIRNGTPYCPDHAGMAYQSSSRTRAIAASEEKVVEDSADDDEVVAVT
ncbi:MAG: gcrA cell cycle regulator family protein [Proteobacteria bacterium]|nr:gcrA cell cycle regulator family protein [Pseudomonadota bacterium]